MCALYLLKFVQTFRKPVAPVRSEPSLRASRTPASPAAAQASTKPAPFAEDANELKVKQAFAKHPQDQRAALHELFDGRPGVSWTPLADPWDNNR
jgi:hypothetical protein